MPLPKSWKTTKKKPQAIEPPQPTTGVRRPPPSPSSGVAEERVPTALPRPPLLIKHKSWSPDAYRDEAWTRQKENHDRRGRRSKSVTDEDLVELRACIELGFGFDSPDTDHGLSDTLPALGLYYAVNKQYYDTVSKSSSSLGSLTSSECDSPCSMGSPHTIFGPGENPQTMKTRLRQWAQVVACSLRQSPR
ncbi:uncharacterized protein LOC131298537 [Rhododendron vialii]|uniref:uncharacterized protein LOC131298537 n=1 Tax=Rhododendron vialii TaxID=182163 RepID=UPI00265F6022|nr:uncharacterized protein LOC131298537 [Rhododendron vialii]